MSINPYARLEKVRWPVEIVEQEKDKILLNFNNIKIFKTMSLSEETIQYPYFKL